MSARIPEPALVRSTLIAATGILAFILGKNIDVSWVEPVCNFYGFAAPVLAGLLIRRVVTPVEDQVGLREGV